MFAIHRILRPIGVRPGRRQFTVPRRVVSTAVTVLALATAACAHAAPAKQAVDYTAYDLLLGEYVKLVSDPGQPVDTRFDYERLFRDPERAAILERVKRQMLDVSPQSLPPRDRLAWGINAYNFLVIRTVTDNLFDQRLTRGKVKGVSTLVRRMRTSVNSMNPGGKPFFEAPVVEIDGVAYNLDTFERKFVFGGHPKDATGAPPRGLDPRAHFALTFGARGCPPLLPVAYRGDSLNRQLDFAARNALIGWRQLQWDPAKEKLSISTLFHWHRGDFGGESGVRSFLQRHAPPDLWKAVAAQPPFPTPSFVPWDWTLNQLLTPQSPPPAEAGPGGAQGAAP